MNATRALQRWQGVQYYDRRELPQCVREAFPLVLCNVSNRRAINPRHEGCYMPCPVVASGNIQARTPRERFEGRENGECLFGYYVGHWCVGYPTVLRDSSQVVKALEFGSKAAQSAADLAMCVPQALGMLSSRRIIKVLITPPASLRAHHRKLPRHHDGRR